MAGALEYTDCNSADGWPTPNECPRYDTKQSDGEFPVSLELWGVQSTPSLPLLPGQLWPRVVVPDWVLSIGQIELNCVLMLNWIVWTRTLFEIETVFVCKTELLEIGQFWLLTICKKKYTYTKLNCLKFNSALNDPKRVDTP